MQESSNNAGHVERFNVKADEAIPRVGEVSIIESHIASEPRGARKLTEQGNDRIVVDPLRSTSRPIWLTRIRQLQRSAR